MKKLTRLAIVSGFVLLQSCTASVKSAPVTSSQSVSPSGSDKYEIHWSGANGKEFYAGYSIVSLDGSTPMRVESVKGKLPHKVSFSAPKNAIVTANGDTFGQGSVEVKIYKNGSECGKVVTVGSGARANKGCQ